MTQLPDLFVRRMRKYLADDFEAFIKTYQDSETRGLRINTLKLTVEAFLSLSPFPLTPIPWTETGFYYSKEFRPGKHPLHAAGLYYIQEPSAMAVVEVLQPKPGEKILDISAAPGGKSTHIAAKMKNTGLFVANEIHPKRIKALVENMERFGVKNTVITNESPKRLATFFPDYFDRILVDAPCSGEGMFRKDPTAIQDWSEENIAYCAIRQQEILDEAAKMLQPGGILVYSTCTFAPEENEGTIASFLKKYPSFAIEPIDDSLSSLFAKGQPEWIGNPPNTSIHHTVRLWPHHIQGEGHFIARLRKKGTPTASLFKEMEYKARADAKAYYQEFAEENLKAPETAGRFHSFGNHLYLVPKELPELSGVKIERLGLHLGEWKKNRFEPSHALAMSLFGSEVKQTYELSNINQAETFLRGETLTISPEIKGWVLLTYYRFPLGWGKASNGQLKNHLPKGLRWR